VGGGVKTRTVELSLAKFLDSTDQRCPCSWAESTEGRTGAWALEIALGWVWMQTPKPFFPLSRS